MADDCDDTMEAFADDVVDVEEVGESESLESIDNGSGGVVAVEAQEQQDEAVEEGEADEHEAEVGRFGGHVWTGGNPFLNSSHVPTPTLAGSRDAYLPTPAQNQQTARDYRAALNNDTTKQVSRE